MPKKQKRWFKCRASAGYVEFWDGTKLTTPPVGAVAKKEMLDRISAIRKDPCPKHGAEMYPLVLSSTGQVQFVCPECRAHKALKREYAGLSEAALKNKKTVAKQTYDRRMAVVAELEQERQDVG